MDATDVMIELLLLIRKVRLFTLKKMRQRPFVLGWHRDIGLRLYFDRQHRTAKAKVVDHPFYGYWVPMIYRTVI